MDTTLFLKKLELLTSVNSTSEFINWFKEGFLPMFEPTSLVLKWGNTHPKLTLRPIFVTDSYPSTLIDKTKTQDPENITPLLMRWRKTELPVITTLEDVARELRGNWHATFRDKSITKICTIGSYDMRADYFSYLCMTDPQVSLLDEEIRRYLTISMPIIHNAISHLRRSKRVKKQNQFNDQLTTREFEILGWIQKGKTNGEIATILEVSFPTIKNHVQNIMVKLNANNRAEAISKAFGMLSPNTSFMDTHIESPSKRY